MPYLATTEAVIARLQGKPATFVASLADLQKERGAATADQAVGLSAPADVNAYLRRDAYTQVGGLQVPIFYFDVEGQQFSRIYPSITYEILDVKPRYNEFIYQSPSYEGDGYVIPVQASKQDVVLDEEDLGLIPRLARTRPVEHPMDIVVELRVYAKDPVQSALLVSYIYGVFPPRHYLRVPQNDGSYRDWDMMFSSYQDLDKRQAVRAGTPGVEREYAKVWNYTVEGYMDNTDMALLQNLVRSREVNFSRMPVR